MTIKEQHTKIHQTKKYDPPIKYDVPRGTIHILAQIFGNVSEKCPSWDQRQLLTLAKENMLTNCQQNLLGGYGYSLFNFLQWE